MLNVLETNTEFSLYPLPAFNDNYIWVLQHNRQAIVVDPGQAQPVLEFLAQQQLELTALFITHHHGDHVGGVRTLKQHYPHATVYGPKHEDIPCKDVALNESDTLQLPGWPISFTVLDVPGHTLGHIAYFLEFTGDTAVLFCGDTLFSVGCGRLFEGTPTQMVESLGKLTALPAHTLVCAAHEYTLSNIAWALQVEPHNSDLLTRQQQAMQQRKRGLPTLPTRMADELASNPFLRAHVPNVAQAARQYAQRPLNNVVEVFACLREWKNNS